MASAPQNSDFSLDVMGRFVCNSFEELKASLLGDLGTNGGAAPVQVFVIGGGTFGGALASALCSVDRATPAFDDPFPHFASRIAILEAGPFFLPEHGQNLPLVTGINTAPPETIASLRAQNRQDKPMELVWGLPWHSDDAFNGLAYCLGGRSVFWGGWSPRYLDSEMPTSKPNQNVRMSLWPQAVKDDLQGLPTGQRPDGGPPYFDVAANVLGVSDPNDFINGGLHVAMRKKFFTDYSKLSNAIPLDELPDYITVEDLAKVSNEVKRSYRLDAPYAVQSKTRPGFFPTNKWSSVPGIMAAVRKAAADSLKTSDDTVNNSRRQLMVVPNCNVKRLVTQLVPNGSGFTRRVTAIETVAGTLPVPTNGIVVVALGAIESARLALNSFGDAPFADQIGKNLMMHVRSNTEFRVPRSNDVFKNIDWKDLQVSAIQVRGRIKHFDGTDGHFHLQVTASAVPSNTGNPESQLFQKVPDIENIQFVNSTPKTDVAIAVRGIGEMESLNPGSSIQLDPEVDSANGMQRAFVRINDDLNRDIPAIRALTAKDAEIKTAMVQATNDVLKLFGVSPRSENSDPTTNVGEQIKLDGLGTTYHESGTLRLGVDPSNSVTNPDGQFHQVVNAYVADLSVAPTCGSANPMQPGIALVRRLARHLAAPPVPKSEQVLFDGSTVKHWRMAGMNSNCFGVFDDRLLMLPAQGQLGLLYCLVPTPPDFELSLEWRTTSIQDNSGIFIRFPDPNKAPPGFNMGFGNPAYVAIRYGFEVQICGRDNGDSEGHQDVSDPKYRRTGVFYNCPGQIIDETVPIDHGGGWNRMRIRAQEQTYEVFFDYPNAAPRRRTRFENNGRTQFVTEVDFPSNTPPIPRATPTNVSFDSPAKAYIGLQTHFDTREVSFRNIRIKPI